MNSQDQVCEVLIYLRTQLVPFKDVTTFSEKPGIYAIGFIGDSFPLNSARNSITSGAVIYIGKAEDSQEARDLNTHFKSGKSGQSTVRRTLGAILREELNLTPIPRSTQTDAKNRFSHYKFTMKGEEQLTEWMVCNLSLAYWEHNGSPTRLADIEKQLIKLACPILNLASNPANVWGNEIKLLRKKCSTLVQSTV